MVAHEEALFWHEEISPCVEFGSSRLEGSQERRNGPYRRRYRNCDDHERDSEHSGRESFRRGWGVGARGQRRKVRRCQLLYTVDLRMLILCASSRLENHS